MSVSRGNSIPAESWPRRKPLSREERERERRERGRERGWKIRNSAPDRQTVDDGFDDEGESQAIKQRIFSCPESSTPDYYTRAHELEMVKCAIGIMDGI